MLERASLLRAQSEAAAALNDRGKLALEINGAGRNFCNTVLSIICALPQGLVNIQKFRKRLILTWQVVLRCVWERRRRVH